MLSFFFRKNRTPQLPSKLLSSTQTHSHLFNTHTMSGRPSCTSPLPLRPSSPTSSLSSLCDSSVSASQPSYRGRPKSIYQLLLSARANATHLDADPLEAVMFPSPKNRKTKERLMKEKVSGKRKERLKLKDIHRLSFVSPFHLVVCSYASKKRRSQQVQTKLFSPLSSTISLPPLPRAPSL